MVPELRPSVVQRWTRAFHVLRLQALHGEMMEAESVELVGDEGEDSLPRDAGGEAAIRVALAQLLELVVQISHAVMLSVTMDEGVRCVTTLW